MKLSGPSSNAPLHPSDPDTGPANTTGAAAPGQPAVVEQAAPVDNSDPEEPETATAPSQSSGSQGAHLWIAVTRAH